MRRRPGGRDRYPRIERTRSRKAAGCSAWTQWGGLGNAVDLGLRKELADVRVVGPPDVVSIDKLVGSGNFASTGWKATIARSDGASQVPGPHRIASRPDFSAIGEEPR